MASATGVDAPSDRLHMEALPLIDLRFLSQSELHALSLSSTSSVTDLRRRTGDDDVVIPKIDRSVFNESAGSRKQTYSRLRLAPRKPQISTSSPTTAIPRRISKSHSDHHSLPVDDPDREDNHKIVELLKRLFAAETQNVGDDNDLVPIRVEYGDSVPKSSNAVFQTVTVDVTVDGGGMKKKRGRKRKSEKAVVMCDNGGNGEDRDKEVLNKNGVVVDLMSLANAGDPFGPELKRRTEGMEGEAELLGFLRGFEGQWGSRRKKRKIVEASDFGDVLPKGWKLLLSLKKKEGRAWLICRRYISPNGREFLSCKEVSSYLLSFFGSQDGSHPNFSHSNESIQLSNEMPSGNAADLTFKGDNKMDDLDCHTPTPEVSISTGYGKQVTLLKTGNPGEVQAGDIFRCHKCTITFDEKDDLFQHLLSSHKSAKRRKLGASISDGVIIKDGNYECQFCHKIFHEKHRYNGHVGIHVKNYVKSVEASAEVITMQKSTDPVFLGGVAPKVSGIQISIVTGCGSIASPCNSKVTDCLNSGYSFSKLKAGSTLEIHADRYNHELNSLSQDRQDMKGNRNENLIVEETSDKQDRDYKMSNDKLGKVDKATNVVATGRNCGLHAETALSNNENDNLGETLDKTYVLKCTTKGGGQERSSESCLFAFSGNEQTCGVKNNVSGVSGVSTSLIEEPKQDMTSESGSLTTYGIEKTCSTENIAGKLFTSTMEELKGDNGEQFGNNESLFGFGSRCTGPDEDVVSEFNQRRNSESFPFVSLRNEKKCGFVSNTNGLFTSIIAESKEESGSERGLLTPPDDEQTFGVNSNGNRVSTSTLDEPKFEELDSSREKEPTFGFGSSHTGPDEGAVSSVEQERSSESCICLPSCNEQICVVDNNVNRVSTCSMEKFCEGKGSESNLLTLSGNEQTYGVEKNVTKVSTSTMEELALDKVTNSRNSELVIAFHGSRGGLDVDFVSSFEPEKRFEDGSLVAPGDEQSYVVQNNATEFCNNRVEESKQERGYESSLLIPSNNRQKNKNNVKKISANTMDEPKLDEVRNSWNSELIIALGSGHAGLDADVVNSSFESSSLVFSGNDQTFSVENNVTGIYNGVVGEPKQERTSGSSLLGHFGNEQTYGVENNLSRGYSGTVWGRHRLEEMENSGNTELMIGFANRQAQPDEDVVADAIWRTDGENVLRNGLAVSSQPLVQSSGCFPTFDFISDKGENELFSVSQKFDSISGFEGLRPGGMEPLEYSFLTAQTNSLSEDSKVLSYDAEMEQGFDSSVWIGKEALLPKIASRNQCTAICVWCRNEFHHEAVNTGKQTGSIGFLCPTCKAKI